MRRVLMSALALVTLLPVVPVRSLSLSAQEPTGTVVGTITDASGRGVQGAEVAVGGESEVRRVLSDRLGRFTLRRVPEGAQPLRVERLGFAAGTAQVDVVAGSIVRIDVVLEEQALGLEPLRVVTEQTRIVGDPGRIADPTGAAHLLTADELQRQPNAFGDVQQALRTLPGVYVQDEEGYGLRPNIGLRGTGVERSSRITLMEDGVLIAPAPYAAPAAYYFPVAARMDAIEVRKGSSQIAYGPRTIGGAINLVSATIPQRTSWSADLASGSESTFRGHARAGGTSGGFGWLVETFQIGTEGFKQLQGGGDTGFRIQDYLGKLRWSTSADAAVAQTFELKIGYTEQQSDETYLGLTDADFSSSPLMRYAATSNDLMDNNHRQLQLRHGLTLGDGISLTTTAYQNDFARNWYKLQSVGGRSLNAIVDDPSSAAPELAILRGGESADDAVMLRANNREYRSQGVQSVLGIRSDVAGTGHDLELGVRLHRDDEDRLQWEDGYRMTGGRLELTSNGAPGSQANRLVEANAVSAWLRDQISIGSWTFTPGLRLESIDFTRTDWAADDTQRATPTRVRENSVTAWIPGVGAAWQATAALQLFGGVHRGFAPPGAGAAAGTESEQSVNVEAGARWTRRGVALSGTLFRSDYDNILGQATLATGGEGIGMQYNGGAVDIQGLEVGIDVDPLWGHASDLRLPIRASYTWTSAEFQTAFESDYEPWGTVEVGDQLPYIPSHQFAVAAALERADWSVEASVLGNSSMRTVAGQGDVSGARGAAGTAGAGTVGAGTAGTDGFAVVHLNAQFHGLREGTLYAGVQNLFDQRYITARRPAGTRPGLPRTLLVGYRITR